MNILVIRTHRFGDILQLTPMIGGLKRLHPHSRIHVVIDEAFADLLRGNPDVDVLVTIPDAAWRLALRTKPEQTDRIRNDVHDLAAALGRIGFDLVINRQYEEGAILASLAGGKRIVGGVWSPERGNVVMDEVTQDLYEVTRRSRRENRRNLADWSCRIAGLPTGMPAAMSFPVTALCRWKADRLLAGLPEGGLIAVQLGAARSFRQWGAERFAEVTAWLSRDKGKTVLLIGGSEEEDLANAVLERLDGTEHSVRSLAGKTDFRGLAGVLERCEVLLTGDTGPMHLAAAVGTPTISLFFGTAYPWETGPYGPGHFILFADVPCAPCIDPAACPHEHRCKRDLTPKLVEHAFETHEIWRNGGAIRWQPDDASTVSLLVTDRNDQGEQILRAAGTNGAGERLPLATHVSAPVGKSLGTPADGLLADVDAVSVVLLSDNPREALAQVPDLLGDIAALAAVCLGTACPDNLAGLYREAAHAGERHDTVTLLDILQHVLKPMLIRIAAMPPNPDAQGR